MHLALGARYTPRAQGSPSAGSALLGSPPRLLVLRAWLSTFSRTGEGACVLKACASQSDERIPLTLTRYDELRSLVLAAWLVEIAAVLLAVATLFWVASLAQLVAHALHRQVFYKLPVQVRYTAKLRK